MAINRADIAKQLLPGLNAIFGLEYSAVDEEHMPLFDIESSDRAFEEEVLMTGFGAAPTKAEGSAVVYDTAQESWTSRYTHETVALAFAVTEEAMEDNLYDTFAKIRARALARAMAQTKQVKAANVYNNGFSAAYPGGDAVALFSSAHPTVGDGNQSNLETAADLAEGTLETAIINTHKIKDDRGIFIGASPVSLHVAPDGQFDADRILASPAVQAARTTTSTLFATLVSSHRVTMSTVVSPTQTHGSSGTTVPMARSSSSEPLLPRRWSQTSTPATFASRPVSVIASAGVIGVSGEAMQASNLH